MGSYKILQVNNNVRTTDQQHKVYCDEPYAQELYDAIMGRGMKSPKDMRIGDLCSAEVVSVNGDCVVLQADSSQTVYMDLSKETRYLEQYGISADAIRPGIRIDLMVDSVDASEYRGSIGAASRAKVRQELMDSLRDGGSAYLVKVKSINEGGFIVDLSGVECFMPGSLAAANRITNFDTMLGREVYVMVESYLDKSGIFVVSNKKYIQTILPARVRELDPTMEYTGTVTGVVPYGCFVEWDEIFTGLLHESELNGMPLASVKAGDTVTFWVKEVRDPNRIILSRRGPNTEALVYQAFKEKSEGRVVPGQVKELKPFGVFMELAPGIVGMITPREFRKTGARQREGEILDVFVKTVDVGARKVHLRSASAANEEDHS